VRFLKSSHISFESQALHVTHVGDWGEFLLECRSRCCCFFDLRKQEKTSARLELAVACSISVLVHTISWKRWAHGILWSVWKAFFYLKSLIYFSRWSQGNRFSMWRIFFNFLRNNPANRWLRTVNSIFVRLSVLVLFLSYSKIKKMPVEDEFDVNIKLLW